ncbi:hypothetical protein ACFGVR_06205 [Mucilaginibacter sp. AW1-3]
MDMNMDMPGMPAANGPVTVGDITEYSLNWLPTTPPTAGSTHELVISDQYIYVTGQNMDQVARFDLATSKIDHFKMPAGSGPHGLLIDKHKRLWVSWEFACKVVQLDENCKVVKEIDVSMNATNAAKPVNVAPHGIGLDADGETIWFTGKRTSGIGKISPNGKVEHFEFKTLAALPIFLFAGPDQCIWGTQLLGNGIIQATHAGQINEYAIPTPNSRPIAVIPDPSEPYMWFTEEAGVNIGKIDMHGNITEYKVPTRHKNDILASLSFDFEGNLWVQVYVDFANPVPAGIDYIIRFDKSIRHVVGTDIHNVPYTMHDVPSRRSMMHRIRPDAKGNLWFTEMMTDRLGKIGLVR